MSRARQFGQSVIRRRFEQDQKRPLVEIEEPCTEPTDEYMCSVDGRYRLYLRADAPMSPPKPFERPELALLKRLGSPSIRPAPVLTFDQMKHARQLIAKWKEWDEPGQYP